MVVIYTFVPIIVLLLCSLSHISIIYLQIVIMEYIISFALVFHVTFSLLHLNQLLWSFPDSFHPSFREVFRNLACRRCCSLSPCPHPTLDSLRAARRGGAAWVRLLRCKKKLKWLRIVENAF